ncbi:MAG: 50S ribosomal protein L5 [Kiritimatiellae bacterium]|nr:50S ribosomal protein L5 [Kiritimatiellia bacterium]
MSTLKERYKTEARPALKEKLGMSNPMQLPKLSKVVVNMGLGIADKDALKARTGELAQITGQQPVRTRARKSISNFKLREGMTIGAKVTLRGTRMYEFLDRLINAALPRIRDFRGVPADAFDGKGNYSLGLKDQMIFPEVDPDKVNASQGMNVTIVTSARNDKEAYELLALLGMPFAKKKDEGVQVG